MQLKKRGKPGAGKQESTTFLLIHHQLIVMSRKLHVRTCQTKRTCVWFCWIFSGD